MYNPTFWKDHAVDPANTYHMVQNPDGTVTLTPAGVVVQQGTNMNALNFNNIEGGVADAHIAAKIIMIDKAQKDRANAEHQANTDAEILGEIHTVTLTNTQKIPFNSTVDNPVSVALTTTRKNLYYTVEAQVDSHNGLVGDIHITDKALNGFKVSFTGSATSVTMTLRIKGGMA